jgi:hypothetical protein
MPNRNINLMPQDALKLKALRQQIQAGRDALDRGDFIEVDDGDLEDFLKSPCNRRRPANRRRS